MVQFGNEFIIRQANITDEHDLRWLIERKSFVHRHLDWGSPLAWLGKQPFLLLEDEKQGLLAALAFPRDDDGIIWLRLFSVAPGFSVSLAWSKLWEAGMDWHQEYSPDSPITSLAIHPEMEKILFTAGFKEMNRVISLVWDVSTARWPEVEKGLDLQKMDPEDLNRCSQIDRVAFKPIWRNTITQLQTAYQEAFYASVIKVNGVVQGYQISTTNPQGGHLARLAVAPAFQKQGLGSKLLSDVLDRFFEVGILDVSVNTQADNLLSLDLYQKFGFVDLPETYPVFQYQPGG